MIGIVEIIQFFIHLDRYLGTAIQDYGTFIYVILFLIIMCETGLVVTPILPGDSLLFAAGTFAAIGSLNIFLLFMLLWVAAVLGDNMNYWIGRFLGPKVFSKDGRFFKKEYLIRTQKFYKKHGGKTIVIGRFMPIIRTFGPFVAGIGKMDYGRFLPIDICGGLLWVGLFTFGGYFFGNVPLVRNNFTVAILIIIFLSMLPGIIQYIKHRK